MRKLEAFRATFPNSKANDKSASVRANEIFKIRSVSVRFAEMREKSRKLTDESFDLSLKYKKQKMFRLLEICSTEIEAREGHLMPADGRTAMLVIAESNKMDGEYEKDNLQKQPTFNLTMNMACKPERKTDD